MAPKRRKKGLTRMDAALDQMSVFGFPRTLVRKTVGNLLKLYGEDGWKLIEEDAYKVLLDVILEEQEASQKQKLLEDASSTKVSVEDSSFQGSCNASLTNNAESSVLEVPLFSTEGQGNQECRKDAVLDTNDVHCSPFDTAGDHSANKVNLQSSVSTCLKGSYDTVHTPLNVPTRRRKPCYGWISDNDSDDDHEEEFLTLTPAI